MIGANIVLSGDVEATTSDAGVITRMFSVATPYATGGVVTKVWGKAAVNIDA